MKELKDHQRRIFLINCLSLDKVIENSQIQLQRC